MATSLHLRPENVRPAGWTPGHTAASYAVLQEGEQIGQVSVQNPMWLVNAGHDVPTWIADTLNGYAERMDEAKLRAALAAVLSL
jgi:hypothetical protein